MNKPGVLQQQVKARREALGAHGAHSAPGQPAASGPHGLPAGSDRLWGLALSGGGIRSATFCFGLLRALARQGLLLRFDVLSTVSGGGYIGAMLGRLFSRAGSAAETQQVAEALKEADGRWFSWWLRANGRYLVPRGAKDRTFALALYLRNLAGVHFELGLLALLLGVGLALVDLGAWALLSALGEEFPGPTFAALRQLPGWLPVVALALPLLGFAGVVVSLAYWCVPWLVASQDAPAGARARPGRRVQLYWLAAPALLGGTLLLHQLLRSPATDVGEAQRLGLLMWVAVLALAWTLALPLCWRLLKRAAAEPGRTPQQQADVVRSRLTRWLANCLRGGTVVVGLAAVDRVAWYIAFELDMQWQAGVLLGGAAALARALLPLASGVIGQGRSIGSLLGLGRLLGYALTFLLCAWWVALVYRAGLGALFQRGPVFGDALRVLAAIGGPALAYLWLSGRNLAFLNLSSLHAFYKARLIRSYLGAANGRRFGRPGALGATEPLPPGQACAMPQVAIGDLEPQDDVALLDYRPQRHGGPVHLINVCINQTRDPRGGLFNQDRRGLPLCLMSGGWMQVAREGWQGLPGRSGLTLGAWTAISGAAVAPGLGSMTRGGISALATFAGLRLGFWWDQATRRDDRRHRSPRTAKSWGLLRETFGSFRGTDRPDWFLTDGGHLENTGAYALLAERAELIVLADCGADPRYAFGDLENLVRMARIDLQAEVLFQRPRQAPGLPAAGGTAPPGAAGRHRDLAAPPAGAAPWPPALRAFGSLNDLASPSSTACLALAIVRYGGERPGRGVLIVVKPNVCDGLPVDLVNFKAENPEFPQQPTADQFFSEAQWESYFQLGQFLGGKLGADLLAVLAEQPETWFEADDRSPFDNSQRAAAGAAAGATAEGAAAAATRPANGRLPARIGATAVNTTIGLGAAATIGVSAWQAIDSLRSSSSKKTGDERAALAELSGLWAQVQPGATPASAAGTAGKLAAALVRTADTLCPAGEANWFQRSALAGQIRDTAISECRGLPRERRPQPCLLLLQLATDDDEPPLLPNCLMPLPRKTLAAPEPRYWVYDYALSARLENAHPCDPAALVRRLRQDANHRPPEVCKDLPRAALVPLALAPAPSVPAPVPALPVPPAPSAPGASRPLPRPVPVPVPAPAPAPVPMPAPPPPPLLPPSAPPPAAPPSAGPPAAEAPAVSAPTAAALPQAQAGFNLLSCAGRTLYLQVQGAQDADTAEAYRERWGLLGAHVPMVEDLQQTARSAGRPVPPAVRRTTVRYHDPASRPCAEALAPSLGLAGWTVEPLSPLYKATPGTVEVWLRAGEALPTLARPVADGPYAAEIRQLAGPYRRSASAALAARPADEQAAVVDALLAALQPPASGLGYRVNLYVLLTLSRMPGGWPGNPAQREQVQALGRSALATDATFRRRLEEALRVWRPR